MSETIKFTLDGREVECAPGTMVLQAALDAGVFIPHYCYHPGLSVAGNCRMCMIEVVPKPVPGRPSPPPKPLIGCATEAAPGMEVLTASPMVLEARTGVLESLLVNHPLDCPVCDQAGECDLQDFSFAHGQPLSRFEEQKHVKHTFDFGPEVRLYGNRCINCTRCVRFSQEISGTSDIVQVNRGGRNVVSTFPGEEFDNSLSGCVVDLCPVGALVSRDFLHKARVWQLEATPSVCPHCSTGCSIEVHVRDEEVMRLKPRPNPEVNGHWMCDRGRLGYGFVHAAGRLSAAERGTGDAREAASFHGAAAEIAERLEEAGDKAFAVASAWMTNEELELLRAIVPAERIALLAAPPGEEERFYPQWGDSERNPSLPGQRERAQLREDGASFVIEADRNPNRAGAKAVLGEGACEPGRLDDVLARAAKGEGSALWVFAGIPGLEAPKPLLEAIEKAGWSCVVDLASGALTGKADLVVPGAAFCEKEGTYTNGRGTTQRLFVARPTVGQARPELELLYSVAKKLGRSVPGFTAQRVFGAVVKRGGPFEGLTWDGLSVSLEARWSPHMAAQGGPKRLPMLPALPDELLEAAAQGGGA